jgi:transcriptional regulator with XRE-family HTH domain
MLARVIDFYGVSQRALERRLGLSRGYLSSILSGRVELRQAHVMGVLLALGIHPSIFFDLAYPRGLPVGPVAFNPDFAQRLARLGVALSEPPLEPMPTPLPETPEELTAYVDGIVRKSLTSERGSTSEARRRRRGDQS